MSDAPTTFRQLYGGDDASAMQLIDVFGDAFEEPENYCSDTVDAAHIKSILDQNHIIVLVAEIDTTVVGGLVAYELQKLERPESEVYIYDLAVNEAYRRRGIATGLIRKVQEIAYQRGAWIIYIQADKNDTAPVSLYTKLGTREDVHHFDIPVARPMR